MLRLVHPAREGQSTRPSKGKRSPALSLTNEERQHLRAALRGLRAKYGSWGAVAKLLGVGYDTVQATAGKGINPRGSGTLAIRAAKLAGTTAEALLSGQIVPAGICPHCGAERRTA